MTSAIGYDEASERELHLLELASLDQLPRLVALPSEHFVCLLVLDGRPAPDAEIHRAAARLLQAGAVSLSVWGPDSERIHDRVEDAILSFEETRSEDEAILAAWHPHAGLEEALLHLIRMSWPAEAYLDSCRAALVVCVGCTDWAQSCREALRRPAEHVARMAVG